MWLFLTLCLFFGLQHVSTSETFTPIFVYGTLKEGEPNGAKLADPSKGNLASLGDATTVEKFKLFVSSSNNIPFIVNSGDASEGYRIKGQLIVVDQEKLEWANYLESWYTPIDTDVVDADGAVLSAKIYVLDKEYPMLEANRTKYLDHYTNGIEGRFYNMPKKDKKDFCNIWFK